ncbi:MAG: glucose-6-phosphate isomerase [Candidatus Brocadiae bacterium]|nr:glucose-6-phosphate isomerase [Candidatus Brocadiia bacterium]
MIKEAIVLAGGMGTRLKSVIADIPKPMAEIQGKPFLAYLMQYLIQQGIERVVLSVGYKHEVIQNYFQANPMPLEILYSVEEKPLGTGGAIQKALSCLAGKEAFVMNGDTFFGISLEYLAKKHRESHSQLSLALKEMKSFDRYGVVTIEKDCRVKGFEEKKWRDKGLINAGIYILSKEIFSDFREKEKFSFEQDFLPVQMPKIIVSGFACEGYFIDIGIPEDYSKAQQELTKFCKKGQFMLSFDNIAKNLQEHAQEVSDLKTLFDSNDQRGKEYAISTEHVYYDYSRQRVDEKTIKMLCDIAEQSGLRKKIQAMFQGEKINRTEDRAVLHIALRHLKHHPKEKNTYPESIQTLVQDVLEKIQKFCKQIHGQTTPKKIKNILSIGIGGSYLGPEFLAVASKPYSLPGMNLAFLANIDGTDFAEKTQNLDPEETLVIVISKTFTTAETMQNANTALEWMQKKTQKTKEEILAKHFVAISSDVEKCKKFGIAEDRIFAMWDWVGGRFSATSAVGALPLSLYLGFENFCQILEGAHWMDQHFLHAEWKENIPVISGLIDIWNINALGCQSRALLPYSQGLSKLAAYTQQGEMESNGKRVDMEGDPIEYNTGEVIFGEPGTNGQHSFYQLLHQGKQIVPCDFIGFMEAPYQVTNSKDIISHHEELMTNFFAQPDALAFGKKSETGHKHFPGNRPSSSALLHKLTPFTAGLLLSWTEHRIAVKGFIWNINSFDQFGVELGKVMGKEHRERIEKYKKTHLVPLDNLNSSTKILLEKFCSG